MSQPTNETLINYHVELQRMRSSVMWVLFRSRINTFYDNNKLRIQTVISKINKLSEKYFVLDANGNQTFPDEVAPGMKSPEPIMKDGMVYADFEAEYKALMNQPTTIVY